MLYSTDMNHPLSRRLAYLTASTIALVAASATAQASALAVKDRASKTITIRARMVYSGPAFTPALADLATHEIQSMWSINCQMFAKS